MQVREQLPELPLGHVIGEPSRRDTAAVNARVALMVKQWFGNAVMAILPQTTGSRPVSTFQEAVRKAVQGAAEAPCLYTMGHPSHLSGYIATGISRGGRQPGRALRGEARLATARSYVESGHYLWNSGMFLLAGRHDPRPVEQPPSPPSPLSDTLRPALALRERRPGRGPSSGCSRSHP